MQAVFLFFDKAYHAKSKLYFARCAFFYFMTLEIYTKNIVFPEKNHKFTFLLFRVEKLPTFMRNLLANYNVNDLIIFGKGKKLREIF